MLLSTTLIAGELAGRIHSTFHDQQSGERSIQVKRRIDGFKQGCVAEWLEQTLHRALCDQSRSDIPICAGGDEDDRNLPSSKLQFALKVGSAHPRHGDVKDQAFGLADAIGGEELLG